LLSTVSSFVYCCCPGPSITAEDKGILDEKGNLVEDDQDVVLENILAVRCCHRTHESTTCMCGCCCARGGEGGGH
jgi:hypothetical protein